MNYNTSKHNNFQYIDKIFRKKSNEVDRVKYFRFDRNERIAPFPNKFLNKLKKNLKSEHLTSYPNFKTLYNLISKDLKLNKNNLLLTAGSDIAIKKCFELLIKKNDHIITIYPTYGMVDVYAKIFRANQKKIYYKEQLNLDISKILKNINRKTKLIILANPNSPTGTIIEQKNLLNIIKKASSMNAFVLIDECYYGFYKETFAKKIHKFKNLIISRSLSKAYGLAGCRIGYLISNKNLIKRFIKLKSMHEISYFSAYTAESFFKNRKVVNDYIFEVKNGLIYFKNFLNKHQLYYFNTYANFILVDFKNQKIFKKMLKEAKKMKILIHGEPNLPGCRNFIKFTLGPINYMKIIEKLILKCI